MILYASFIFSSSNPTRRSRSRLLRIILKCYHSGSITGHSICPAFDSLCISIWDWRSDIRLDCSRMVITSSPRRSCSIDIIAALFFSTGLSLVRICRRRIAENIGESNPPLFCSAASICFSKSFFQHSTLSRSVERNWIVRTGATSKGRGFGDSVICT